MIDEMTLPQVVVRLQKLEENVKAISTRLPFPPALPQFEFVIRVDEQELWSGLDLETHYPKIRSEYPEAEVSVGWRSSPVVLV